MSRYKLTTRKISIILSSLFFSSLYINAPNVYKNKRTTIFIGQSGEKTGLLFSNNSSTGCLAGKVFGLSNGLKPDLLFPFSEYDLLLEPVRPPICYSR